VGDPSMLRGAAWPPQFPGAKENPASAGLKLSEADGATKVEKYSRGPPSRPPPDGPPGHAGWEMEVLSRDLSRALIAPASVTDGRSQNPSGTMMGIFTGYPHCRGQGIR